MLYLIDGYNFLFRFLNKDSKIENQRNEIISFIDSKAKLLNLKVIIIFDGYHQNINLPNRTYTEHIQVIYTSKNQTADDYILEKINLSKHPDQIIVISSDNILNRKARYMKAKTKSVETFLKNLQEKEEKIKVEVDDIDYSDTSKNIKRLLKIFHEKMKKPFDD